jgi:hypothetical protein
MQLNEGDIIQVDGQHLLQAWSRDDYDDYLCKEDIGIITYICNESRDICLLVGGVLLQANHNQIKKLIDF